MVRCNANSTGGIHNRKALVPKKLRPSNDIKKNHTKCDEAIKQVWNLMPQQAFTFLQETPSARINVQSLAQFWSAPTVVEYTSMPRADGVCSMSFSTALNYLNEGKVQLARTLMLNGAFILECRVRRCHLSWLGMYVHYSIMGPVCTLFSRFAGLPYSIENTHSHHCRPVSTAYQRAEYLRTRTV